MGGGGGGWGAAPKALISGEAECHERRPAASGWNAGGQ